MSKQNRVSNVDFISAFKNASSYKDVAEKTGLNSDYVKTRAAKLREKGVTNIPVFSTARKTVSDNVLVAAYNESNNWNDVVEKTGLALTTLKARVSKLRKNGEDLPLFHRHKVEVDVDRLNAILANINE